MTAAVTAICGTYFEFPLIGFEGMAFISSVAVVLALGAATMSLTLTIFLFIRHRSPRPTSPAIVASPCDRAGPGIPVDDVTLNSPLARHPQ
jgi:hypothetical protein